MPDRIQTDWKSIIYRGVESEELDYKAAVDWRKLSRTGKAKFARHCLALANTKGGYIVVGVGEDSAGQPSLFTGLTPEQSKSFDPTIIGNFINKYADPELDFTLERPIVDGKRYAVFVIHRFSDIPHVCAYGLNNELQQGVFYIRTADAASRPAYRASEIHGLVQRSLRNQRELLGRMIRGVLYENRNTPEANSAQSHFVEENSVSRNFFLRRRQAPKSATLLEISINPQEYVSEKFSLSEIQRTATNALSPLSSVSFITENDMADGYFSNMALRVFPDKGNKMLQIFKTGLLHYICYFPTPRKIIDYQELVKLLSEAVSFISNLYAELGYDEELLDICIRFNNVEGIILNNLPPLNRGGKKLKSDCICRIPDIRIKLQRTAADLASGYIEHTARIIKEVCERFNLPDGKHGNLQKRIAQSLGKRY